jgi:hypothetical protein
MSYLEYRVLLEIFDYAVRTCIDLNQLDDRSAGNRLPARSNTSTVLREISRAGGPHMPPTLSRNVIALGLVSLRMAISSAVIHGL